MTFNSDPSTFLDKEQEALWYLGGQRIINALGERIEGAFRLTEFVTPAGTFVSAYRHKEDEAHYVIEGEATISCGGQVFHVSAGCLLKKCFYRLGNFVRASPIWYTQGKRG